MESKEEGLTDSTNKVLEAKNEEIENDHSSRLLNTIVPKPPPPSYQVFKPTVGNVQNVRMGLMANSNQPPPYNTQHGDYINKVSNNNSMNIKKLDSNESKENRNDDNQAPIFV